MLQTFLTIHATVLAAKVSFTETNEYYIPEKYVYRFYEAEPSLLLINI